MELKVIKNIKPDSKSSDFKISVRFEIHDIEDEEIVKLVRFSPLYIIFDPKECGISSYTWKPISLAQQHWIFKLHSKKN